MGIACVTKFFRSSAGVFCCCFAFLVPSIAHAVVPSEQKPIALIRALDKVTARVEPLEIPVDKPLKFGTIVIAVRDCRVTPPEETPEAAAFVEVSEFKIGEKETPLFRGWMFASTPALSALEHPVYDLWVTGCKGQTIGVKPEEKDQSSQ